MTNVGLLAAARTWGETGGLKMLQSGRFA